MQGTVPAPTRPWGPAAAERTDEGRAGPSRRVGRRKGPSRPDSLPRLPAGLRESDRIGPSSRSTECKGTDEMETRTAGGMTWPASHCPLLGRVVPSSTDVSSEAKERTGKRDRKRNCVNLLFSKGMAFRPRKTCPINGPWRSIPAWQRVQILARPLSHLVTLGLRARRVPSVGPRPDPNCNVLEFLS